jgi:hypothetical protein
MKGNRIRKSILWSQIIIMLLIPLIFISCEPLVSIVLENQTTQILSVFVDSTLIGKIEPRNQIAEKYSAAGFSYKFLIEAKDEQGQIVFSERISRQQMQHEKGSNVYKVVIPVLKESMESSNTTAGK